MSKFFWLIDPGHGQLTQDKHSPRFTDGSVYHEYEFTYNVANQLVSLLKEEGIETTLTKESPIGVGNAAASRVRAANKLQTYTPKILLSIHSNLHPPLHEWQDWESGIEAWHGANSFIGRRVGKRICDSVSSWVGMINRGPKHKDTNQFYLIANTDMPCIVLEIGFLNHSEEISKLMDIGIQEQIALAICEAIKQVESIDNF